jgi:hypothetical protein
LASRASMYGLRWASVFFGGPLAFVWFRGFMTGETSHGTSLGSVCVCLVCALVR